MLWEGVPLPLFCFPLVYHHFSGFSTDSSGHLAMINVFLFQVQPYTLQSPPAFKKLELKFYEASSENLLSSVSDSFRLWVRVSFYTVVWTFPKVLSLKSRNPRIPEIVVPETAGLWIFMLQIKNLKPRVVKNNIAKIWKWKALSNNDIVFTGIFLWSSKLKPNESCGKISMFNSWFPGKLTLGMKKLYNVFTVTTGVKWKLPKKSCRSC